jgi:hypothetical protein
MIIFVPVQAEKLDVMLERRREPLDAVVEFSIGKSYSLGSHQFYLDRLEKLEPFGHSLLFKHFMPHCGAVVPLLWIVH